MNKNFDIKKSQSRAVDLRVRNISRSPLIRSSTKQPAKLKKFFWTAFFILLSIAGAVALGFFVFYKNSGTENSLKVNLALPSSAKSGGEVNLVVTYENIDKVPLKELELRLTYPKGFYFTNSSQSSVNKENDLWKLPDLEVGQSAELKISGVVYGQKEEAKEFALALGYRPSNFNSRFTEKLNANVSISDNFLVVDTNWPDNIAEGQEFAGSFKIRNETAEAVKNLILAVEAPVTLTWSESSPTSTAPGNWGLGELGANSSQDINFKLNISNSTQSEIPFKIKLWQSDQPEKMLVEKIETVKIAKPDLVVAWPQELTGLAAGKSFKNELTLKNNGQAEVVIKKLSLKNIDNIIDWTKARGSSDAQVDNNQSLVWLPSGNLVKKMNNFSSGQELKLGYQLQLKDQAQLDKEKINAIGLSLQLEITLDWNGSEKVINLNSQSYNLSTSTNFTARALYNLDENKKVGSGPIPPQVGQETSYRVYWKINNGTKDLKDIQVKTIIPDWATFLPEKVNAGSFGAITYQEKGRQIIWKFDNLVKGQVAQVSFGIKIKPNSSQIGQAVNLITTSSLSATDEENVKASRTAKALTSDLIDDPIFPNMGKVIN